ncbi:MAG: hypothetical protein IJZ20_07325, partial [Clostridia bacterium]|nr:hypothetical protein [Clostridia bacterium]
VTSGDDTNILNFRFATTEEGVPTVVPGPVYMYGNYAVMESFSFNDGKNLPVGWTGDGVYDSGDTLVVPNDGYAARSFDPVSGKVVAEAMLLLPEGESVTYTLKSGSKVVAEFKSDADNFYMNGTKVYENYYANLWYRLRFEADTDRQVILVKVNGKKQCEVPFMEAATSADNIYLANESETEAVFDDIEVFRIYDREDYVPEPVIPEGEEEYIVGMNVCSLW